MDHSQTRTLRHAECRATKPTPRPTTAQAARSGSPSQLARVTPSDGVCSTAAPESVSPPSSTASPNRLEPRVGARSHPERPAVTREVNAVRAPGSPMTLAREHAPGPRSVGGRHTHRARLSRLVTVARAELRRRAIGELSISFRTRLRIAPSSRLPRTGCRRRMASDDADDTRC